MGITTSLPLDAFGKSSCLRSSERLLTLYNIHTGEHFSDTYWADGQYLGDSLIKINRIFRDYRTDDIMPIDTGLLDLLHSIHMAFDGHCTIEVVSGYRSSKTNDYLRRTGHRVARNSFHQYGRAADITLQGISLADLLKTAVEMKGGGVGYYPRQKFVHIDTGPVRQW